MRRWQLQEAKARLCELVRSAQSEGPQEISVRGEAAVVVLSKTEYDKLRQRKPSLLEFLGRSPLAGLKLRDERDRRPARDVPL